MSSATLLISFGALAGCRNNSSNDAKLKSENSSLKREVTSLRAQIKTQSGTTSKEDKGESDSTIKTTEPNAVMGKEYIIKDKSGKKLVGLTLTQADNKLSGIAVEHDLINDTNFNQGKKDNIIQLSMKYTNYGLKDDWQPVTGIDVYDSTGTQATKVSYSDGSDMVSVGHSGALTTWYVLSQPVAKNHKLEIEYSEYLTAAGADDSELYKAKWVIAQ